MAHLHIVRQPVFLRNKDVFAYELLYRPDEFFADPLHKDTDAESLRALTAGFMGAGIDTLTGGKPVLVNFTEYLLTKGLAMIFPNEQLYIGIDRNVRPNAGVLEAIKGLKDGGYRLVLGGYSANSDWAEHIKLFDIIKADFQDPKSSREAALKGQQRRTAVQFMAAGIDTHADFDEACKAGFTLFQGFFFTQPATLSVTTVPISRLNLMLLLKELIRFDPDTERIRRDIEMDVGLTYEILKLVNSAYYYKSRKINSIRSALAYLGIQGIKKWVMMSTLAGQGEKNNEAVELAMLRSRFMEQLGMLFVYGNKIEEYTLTGLFSLLEALTDCPFSVLFEQISVPEEVYAILAEGRRDTLMGQCFRLVELYEKGLFAECRIIAEKLGFTIDQVEAMYNVSLRWLNANRAQD
jgi:c-di-GMP-related signal transduction protein